MSSSELIFFKNWLWYWIMYINVNRPTSLTYEAVGRFFFLEVNGKYSKANLPAG